MMDNRFSHIEISLVIGGTAAVLMLAVLFNFPLAAAIVPGFLMLTVIALKKGYKSSELWQFSITGIKRNKNIAWLLAFIGVILPTWYYSGTIGHLNDLFLSLISPEYFFTAAFIAAAVMSLIIGSAVGSLSIIGLPVMGAAEALGIPAALTAGALVSGAFVGDRTSPLSSSFQLLSFSVELEQRKQLKTIVPTMLISAALTACIFFVVDQIVDKGSAGASVEGMNVNELLTGSLFVSLIPPLVLSIMILLGKNMKLSFSAGIGSAAVILLFRGVPVSEWLYGSIFGTGALGGFQGMFPFIIFILIVGAYCQIIEDTKMIQPYINRIFRDTTSLPKNTAKTIGVAAGVSLISPNQSFPILLAGRSLLPFWKTHFSKEHLARILADSTVVFAGIVPWSLLAILCSTILSVPVLAYAPYAVFLYLTCVVTMLYSMRKSRQAKKTVSAAS
ncbi:Na+/H+ antiporter NhaC family protein [Evansella clarkii]|uniref:Na+/H+ antiporter NhaC family protein n=1 Tax=Evansella clarkii TaxID=79879 RepID=UPI0009961D56|nr:Na+/H+ antiporter NhaC family protein [Evansella clarkii]